jgi:septum formation protein
VAKVKTLSAARSFVYLASQSPRRAQLLDQLGVKHRPLLADDHEDAEALEALMPGERPTDYVERVVQAKFQAALRRLKLRGLPVAPVLVADTTVAVGHTVLGKPADAAQARAMLQRLSGGSHRVCTAVAVGTATRHHAALSVSRVQVQVLSAQALRDYVDSGEPFGKAGAYAIQGRFAAYITGIQGSHSGIMGLPLHETAQLLQRAGVRF